MKKIGLFISCVSFSLFSMQESDDLADKINYACTVLQECAMNNSVEADLRTKLHKEMFVGVKCMALSLFVRDLRTKIVLSDEEKQASLLKAIDCLNVPISNKNKGEDTFKQECVKRINEYGAQKAVTIAHDLRQLVNQIIDEINRKNRSNPTSPTGYSGGFVFEK